MRRVCFRMLLSSFGSMRKPFGEGKLACQRQRRKQLCKKLSAQLLGILDVELAERTGCLFPRCQDLRKRHNQKFRILRHYSGRVFTQKLCLTVCKSLMRQLNLAVDPSLDLDTAARSQAKRLQKLAKRSKRLMVEGDTLPYVTWRLRTI